MSEQSKIWIVFTTLKVHPFPHLHFLTLKISFTVMVWIPLRFLLQWLQLLYLLPALKIFQNAIGNLQICDCTNIYTCYVQAENIPVTDAAQKQFKRIFHSSTTRKQPWKHYNGAFWNVIHINGKYVQTYSFGYIKGKYQLYPRKQLNGVLEQTVIIFKLNVVEHIISGRTAIAGKHIHMVTALCHLRIAKLSNDLSFAVGYNGRKLN